MLLARNLSHQDLGKYVKRNHCRPTTITASSTLLEANARLRPEPKNDGTRRKQAFSSAGDETRVLSPYVAISLELHYWLNHSLSLQCILRAAPVARATQKHTRRGPTSSSHAQTMRTRERGVRTRPQGYARTSRQKTEHGRESTRLRWLATTPSRDPIPSLNGHPGSVYGKSPSPCRRAGWRESATRVTDEKSLRERRDKNKN